MEHTNEFLQGMFAAYMGCELQYDTPFSEAVGEPFAIGTIGLWVSIKEVNCTEYILYKEHNPKPILTPLSEITDEDAVEVAKIIYGDEFPNSAWLMSRDNHPYFVCLNNVDDDDYSIIFTTGGDFKSNICIEAFMPNNQHTTMFHVSDYLRFKKYDCGYMHIPSLITDGLAIKKTI